MAAIASNAMRELIEIEFQIGGWPTGQPFSSPDLIPHQKPDIRGHVIDGPCKNQANIVFYGASGLSHKRWRTVNMGFSAPKGE
jgi:hypothetical protein